MLFTMLISKVLLQNLKIIFSNIPFVTSFHKAADNKVIMKIIKRKIKNTPTDYIKTYSYHNVNQKIY